MKVLGKDIDYKGYQFSTRVKMETKVLDGILVHTVILHSYDSNVYQFPCVYDKIERTLHSVEELEKQAIDNLERENFYRFHPDL